MDGVRSEPRGWLPHLRAVALTAAAGCAAGGLYQLQVVDRPRWGAWLLCAALAVGTAAQLALRYPVPEPAPPPLPAPLRQRLMGLLLAALGVALWTFATVRIYLAWAAEFDNAWIGWTAAVVLIAIGLDLAWGRWAPPAQRRWGAWVLVAMAIITAVAALYRLGNIRDFPGEAAITQIEDLQVGNFGWAYLQGYRLRWEYLSSTWLAALGIWLGGPSQFAMRIPFAVVSVLKVVPLFVWLRLTVGTAGALVGTSLLAGSFWDVMLSRIPNNHNALIVSIVFALLAGPVRRGRPSAYVLLGYFGGYILHEYIAYRPLAAFAIAGAVVWSLRDAAAPWSLRLARPLVTVALMATMVMPLFMVRVAGRFNLEYLDGWNRAHGITGYYNPDDSWSASVERRVERAESVAELFTASGDRSPVRNVAEQPPLIDPVTCALLVLGIAAAVGNALRPVHALTLIGLVVTVSGTLIFTGNFDVARVGGAVPYVYALAGFGAAGLYTTWAQAWGRPGRALMALLLALGVVGGVAWSTRYLIELWTSPEIRRAHRNNLAYLTIWMRDNVGPGERVLGIAPGNTNALEGHDGSWLRGGPIGGAVVWDIESALRLWEQQPGPTVFFVFAGRATSAIAQFLSSRFPELTFRTDPDPLDLQADIAATHVPGPPPELRERLAQWNCRGAHGQFTIVGPDPGEVQLQLDVVEPFISKSTWPAVIPDRLYRLTRRPTGIHVRFTSEFTIETAGDYRFSLELYAGHGTLHIDGVSRDIYANVPVPLAAGTHRLEMIADFAPMAIEPSIELRWKGPDTGDVVELMPFYRLAPLDPACAGEGGAPGPTAIPPFLSDWLVLGPFDNRGGSGVVVNFINVPQLAAPGAAEGTAERRWTPLAQHDAFVNLANAFAAGPDGAHPTCAYAATQVESAQARPASLQLAGSSNRLQVWLNGEELTPGPISFGHDLMRRPVELRDGPNLLVVKSCGEAEGWYFVARLTDPDGRAIPDLQAHAALPAAPIGGDVRRAPALQLVEGLDAVVAARHEGLYADHRGGTPSSWTYVDDPQARLTWRTAPVPERARTAVALTASMSRDPANAELLVGGRPVLRFRVGPEGAGGPWSANGYQVAFVNRGYFEGSSGVLLVGVPADAVTPGEPLELTVTLNGEAPRAWLMLKQRRDTVEHEALTPDSVNALLHGEWESVSPSP